MKNQELMTNNELKEKLKALSNQFEDKKTIIARAYADMKELQSEYETVESILNKREGKTE